MARISLPEVTTRTTSDGAGYPHGIAAATDDDPVGALAGLAAEARRIIGELIEAADPAGIDMLEPGDWGVEVVDVRLVAAPDADQRPAWTAYGTLRTTGLSPLMREQDR
jgi:hypothetical protein